MQKRIIAKKNRFVVKRTGCKWGPRRLAPLADFAMSMKRKSYSDSPSSPPPLKLECNIENFEKEAVPVMQLEMGTGSRIELLIGNMESSMDETTMRETKSVTEAELHCNEEMPVFSPRVPDYNISRNMKRRRVLPPVFLAPPLSPLPEDSAEDTEAFVGDRETLCRMRMAAQIVFGDLEDREAERMRENADYYEGDTPHTSQESRLSDYNWSTREGGDTVPLDEIMQFIWKYLARPRIYDRVATFARLNEGMFESDPDSVKDTVANILNCEPVVLLNTLEDAIEVAEGIFQAGGESDSEFENDFENERERLAD